jgi:acyl carrier protein
MSEQDDRLVRCFASVFPTLSDEEIRACDVVPLVDLDSLAGVTLVTVIDEEFGVSVELSQLLELQSFGAISEFLREERASSTPAHERDAK